MRDKCDRLWRELSQTRRYAPPTYVRFCYLKRILGKLRGSVLDVGCGDGSFAKEMLKCDEYVGIDHSEVAIRKARKIGLRCMRMDVSRIAFDRKFDNVIAIEVLEHVRADREVLRGIGRVLKRGGKLVISTPVNQRRFGPLDVQSGHVRRYDPARLARMLEEEGFSVEKAIFTGFPLSGMVRRFQNVMSRLRGGKSPKKLYMPTGSRLRIYLRIAPLILPIFKLDMLFSGPRFSRYSLGVIMVATKS